MNKKLYIILAVVAIIIVASAIWLVLRRSANETPTNPIDQSQTMKGDSIQAINQDLNSIDIGNLDDDFKAVDKDVNSL